MQTAEGPPTKQVQERERVVVRFAGDSGDGMQVVGGRFTEATAVLGNDLATLPDFPGEIRAPAGTVAGVSSFQIHFAARDIATPGDSPDVLVAMNPAALRSNIDALERGATILLNEDAFTTRNLEKAGYDANPLEDGSLQPFVVRRVPITSLTQRAVQEVEGTSTKDAQRAKNMFALGLVCWLFDRPLDVTERWITKKFAKRESAMKANLAAFRAGWNFGETTELMDVRYRVPAAEDMPAGTYRNVTGTIATALGLMAASVSSGLDLFYCSYPITPASELLHELAGLEHSGVGTMQAEDEIAAINIALGASFGGSLAVTGTSGPGLDLMSETLGLACSLELPLLVIDVQRAGPSTGMPTRTEQTDLLTAMHGRHGEAPLPVVAGSTPGQCFDAAIDAARIAIRYRTPVILLLDLFLANSSEPWRIPDVAELPKIDPDFAAAPTDDGFFLPYARDENGARPWARPGTPGLAHRIGGLEKTHAGDISYEAHNHAVMTAEREAKVAGVEVPALTVDADEGAEVLLLGWGSSRGALQAGVRRVRKQGKAVAYAHLHNLNPLPANTEEVLRGYPRVLVAEMNTGQLAHHLRGKFAIDIERHTKVEGQPLYAAEIEQALLERL